MVKTTKYRIFYAYSDESAGEIGTVYQACNWYYLGKMAGGGSQIKFIKPNGEKVTSRHIIKYAKKIDKTCNDVTTAREILIKCGWTIDRTKPKAKYAWIGGNKYERMNLLKNLKYEIKPYPKRA